MSVYKVIDIIGTSSNSWEEAAAEAVRTVRQTIRDVRVAEVIRTGFVRAVLHRHDFLFLVGEEFVDFANIPVR